MKNRSHQSPIAATQTSRLRCAVLHFAALVVFIFAGVIPVSAQDTAGVPANSAQDPATSSGEAAQEPEAPEGQIGGPGSVQEQTRRNREQSRDVLKEFGDRLRANFGLTLGADYNVLPQLASDGPGENAAASGVFRLYGHWKPFNRDSPSAGSLVFKVEHRHLLGTEISPQELGPTIGVAGITGAVWSDAGGMLSNLYWTQAFADNRYAFNAGIVDVTDYVDMFGLVNPWTDFSNLAFSVSPTIPAPNMGLGAVGRWMFTPNFYVIGGVADANGDPTQPGDMFSNLGEGELFKHVEFGWIGSWATRYSDNIHLTLWQVDERVDAEVEGGWGGVLSFSHTLGERWLPFVRGGFSDGGGTIVDRMVSTGIGYQLSERNDYFGIGVNWGRPPKALAGDNPKDQYTIETYYRVQVVPNLMIVPSAQFVIDPALDPTRGSLWILGLKIRAAF